MTGRVLVCCFGVEQPPALNGEVDWRTLPGVADPIEALRVGFSETDGPVAVLDARQPVPPAWLEALQRGLESDPLADAVTPLDAGQPLLTPWARGTTAPTDPAEADRVVRMYADRLFFPQRALSPTLSLWRREPAGFASVESLEALAEGSLRILSCDHLLVPSAVSAAPQAGPLDLLRYRLDRALAVAVPDTVELRSDMRETVLHVTHSWGGGIPRWITDFIEALDDRRHVVLMSRGDNRGLDCGRFLELRVGAVDSPPVRAWPLPSSIRSVDDRSPEHAAILQAVLRDWGVGQVVVSSLIGHSLDVLETGLPTLVVCHDYFPAWPNLDVDFEGDTEPFDRDRLEGRDSKRGWFPDLNADRWQSVRDAYLERIAGDEIQLVAPSQSVVDNLSRLHDDFSARDIQVIPHGHRALPRRPAHEGQPARRDGKWRIVVPGRISAGKGKALVRAIGERFHDQVELFLLGAGRDGHDFFGLSGFNVVLQYDREELPELIDTIAPDFALLASTVSETFSYTLSEMWALGVPVVGTRRGALGERIEDGRNGALIEPTLEAFEAFLEGLHPEQLEGWREAIASVALPDLAAMGEAYRALLPTPPTIVPEPRHTEPLSFITFLLAGEDLRLQQSLDSATQRITAQQIELDRRGSWGFRISRELEERSEWARRLDEDLKTARERLEERQDELNRELDKARGHLENQQAELDERLAWAKALDTDLSRAREQLSEQEAELDKRVAWARTLDGELSIARERLQVQEDELEERTRWARELDEQARRQKKRLDALQRELDDRTAWAFELDQLLGAAKVEIEARGQALTTMTSERDVLATQRDRLVDERNELLTGRDRLMREYDYLMEKHQQVITSRSWWLTKPLRLVTRTISRTTQGILSRTRRAASLVSRTGRSLKIRGVGGTARRIAQEFHKPKPNATPRQQVVVGGDQAELRYPEVDAPRVSVVIPVHNHYDHTHTCLQSLLDTESDASFEVVVVDDASSDETPERLAEIPGIVHLRNEENLGFVGTCNRGAEASRGEFVVFLNNDTAVSDHWLDALLGTFETFDDAGLVGAKLVYPDGRLQEAGGIVFSDGSGWNYGRFGNPDDPAYNYVREVDYCSGAAIMLRRDLFAELGAFDTRYAPAYYEDTDLAFAVRAHGLKVYFQPAATVTHFEGVTAGTDTGSGTKRYQIINQEKFLAKWKDALARQTPAGTPIQRARDHGRPRRALVIDACTPEPDKDSGSVRMVHLLELLRELGYQVSFFAENRAFAGQYSEALQRMGVEVWYHPWLDHSPKFFEDAQDTFDVAILSRHYVATQFIEPLRRHCPSARLLFDTVDLHFLREQRLAELENDERLAATARKTREQELGVARACDVTLVVSPYEQEFLAKEAPELDVAVISNIHHVHGRRKAWAEREGIMFVGGYQHPPNIDAVTWFANDIFPLVRMELPDVVFHVIGSKATPEVEKLGELEGVTFHGFVDEIEPYLDGCRIAVAPLRYGAGVKGKVNSSMSYGQPVVATTPAVEGMFVTPGDDVLVAEDPETFAREVVRAYRDEALWNRLSDGGLENVRRYFSFEAAKQAIAEALEVREEPEQARARTTA